MAREVGQQKLTALHRLKDINDNCLAEFRAHWQCLDNNNHQMWYCRRPERVLNRCVYQKIVRCTGLLRTLNTNMTTGPRKGHTRCTKERDTSSYAQLANLREPQESAQER